jgi:hypothetical protein
MRPNCSPMQECQRGALQRLSCELLSSGVPQAGMSKERLKPLCVSRRLGIAETTFMTCACTRGILYLMTRALQNAKLCSRGAH